MNIDLQDENSRDELVRDFKRISEADEKRGHAGFYAVPKDDPELGEKRGHWREIQESGCVQDFTKSLSAEFGIEISEIDSNPDDPPDCFAKREGEKIGIEVTELVKSEILSQVAQSQKGIRDYSPWEQLLDEEWTRAEFTKRVEELITQKDGKAKNKGLIFDLLFIYTDEGGLPPERLEDWLSNQKFSATNIKEVFLLRSYWPDYREYAPIFKLNVE